MSQIQLERAQLREFHSLRSKGKFSGQRLGQAFYNHFQLHKLADQTQLRGLYEADGQQAHQIICQVFHFN